MASTAVASGVPVSLWLAGEAAWFALPGRADDFSLPHAAPLADLLASVLALGTVTICTQCAARRDITRGRDPRASGSPARPRSSPRSWPTTPRRSSTSWYATTAAVTAARRSARRRLASSSACGDSGGSGPVAQVSSRSARPGLRTRAGPAGRCRAPGRRRRLRCRRRCRCRAWYGRVAGPPGRAG